MSPSTKIQYIYNIKNLYNNNFKNPIYKDLNNKRVKSILKPKMYSVFEDHYKKVFNR